MAGRSKNKETDPQATLQRQLKGLGLASEAELGLCVPRRYEDYTIICSSFTAALGQNRAIVRVRIDDCRMDFSRSPVRGYFKVVDTLGNSASMSVFGNPFQFKQIPEGEWFHVACTVSVFDHDRLSINKAELVPKQWVGHVVPVYASKRGVIAGDTIRTLIQSRWPAYKAEAVRAICEKLGMTEQEMFWQASLDEMGMQSIGEMLDQIHFPDNHERAMAAQQTVRRLAAFQIVNACKRQSERMPNARSALGIAWETVSRLAERLPFELTKDQKIAIRDVINDLNSPMPMDRILLGDVGCGKSAVILVAAAAAQNQGKRVAALLPNELLVDQLYDELRQSFPDVPAYKIVSGKKPVFDPQENPVLIGTTSLLHFLQKRQKSYGKPDLLICDEQQKMSREQRELLKHNATNMLEATATCIPRTSALVMYGAKAASVIRELPVKKDILTLLVDVDTRKRMFATVKKVVQEGGQVAVIYHRVDDGGKDESAKKSVEAAATMWERHFPGRVGVIHGKMKADEQLAVIAQMKSNRINVVVATTVLETGLTLPALKALVVVHAERHGLSALHQLRGRVARKGGKGYFLLYVPEEISDESRARLQLLVDHADGFTLAQKDMETRGFGDLSDDSTEQAGVSRTLFLGIDLMPKDLEIYLNENDLPAPAAAARGFGRTASERTPRSNLARLAATGQVS